MTEQKFFAPLAIAPDDFDFEEVDDDEELDEIEICPGVFASRNILEGAPGADAAAEGKK